MPPSFLQLTILKELSTRYARAVIVPGEAVARVLILLFCQAMLPFLLLFHVNATCQTHLHHPTLRIRVVPEPSIHFDPMLSQLRVVPW